MKTIYQCTSLLLAAAFLLPCVPRAAAEETVQTVVLSGNSEGHQALLNGTAVPEYDYTWHADPETAHTDVKNAPAEYYTGTKPSGEDAVYIAHDIIYYPELEQERFQQVRYDGETEWVYRYGAQEYQDYIFSTLPVQRGGFPSHMMHSPEEAYRNAVLHITRSGTYRLQGQWTGQVWVDLGEEAYTDPSQRVTLILDGVDISCSVAPGLVFYSVYECDSGWEDAGGYSQTVDTTQAGANVVLADGSVNQVAGTNVFRLLKAKYKDEKSQEQYPAQKKSWKMDGAFYSYQSMNIAGESQGTGILNITAGYEGLDTEHHLTINGGNVNIYSQDDGINVNEDGVSVLTVNGGSLHICAGLGAEGDGIDSNGFLAINGGSVITMANPAADSGLDSDCGSFVNGGTVVALGAAMDWAEADETAGTGQPVLNLRFSGAQSADEAIVITDVQNQVVFAYDPDQDEIARDNQRTYQGAIISAPDLQVGQSYGIHIGGDVTGTEVSGIYDTATVTGFTGAVRQCWASTQMGGFGGGRPGGRPDGGEMPPMDMERPETGQHMEMDFGQMGKPADFQTGSATCLQKQSFPLSKQVSAFSGVTDFAHELTEEEAGYRCADCGKLFADAAAQEELTPSEPKQPNLLLWGILVFLAGAIAGAAVMWLITRNKKACR